MNKSKRGITLIALVITIIVLLILAGISITMLSGDNTILNQAINAKTNSIHGNIIEKLRLDVTGNYIDKLTGNTSNGIIEYLTSKEIIGEEIKDENNEETRKWQINVEKLLGSKQSIGNGSNYKDVYMLEEKEEDGKKNYEVNYYEKDESTKFNVGMLNGLNTTVAEDPFTLRYEYGYLWMDCDDWRIDIDNKDDSKINKILENYLLVVEHELKKGGYSDEQIASVNETARENLKNASITEKRESVKYLIDSGMKCATCFHDIPDGGYIQPDKGYEFVWDIADIGNYKMQYINLEMTPWLYEKQINIDTLEPYKIKRKIGVYDDGSGRVEIGVFKLDNGYYEYISPDSVIMKINGEEVVNGTPIAENTYHISKEYEQGKTYIGEITAFIGERQVTYKGPIYVSGGE